MKQIYSVEKLSKRLTARLNIGKVEGNIEKYLTSDRDQLTDTAAVMATERQFILVPQIG